MMQKPAQAALLVGSPKGSRSTSNSLGSFLAEKLHEKGVSSKTLYINKSLGSTETRLSLLRLVDESDLIILAFPLYVDSFHSQMIKTLELIAGHEKGKRDLDKKSVVTIVNSGFPEVRHNNIALAVCRLFAKQVGFSWAGGLATGGGGIVSGMSLNKVGGRVRNQVKALEIAAEALAKGEPVPDKAVVLMGKLGIPRWMYPWMGNRGWKQDGERQMPVEKMYNQPYKKNIPKLRICLNSLLHKFFYPKSSALAVDVL